MTLNNLIVAYPYINKLAKIDSLPTGMKYKLFSIMRAAEEELKFYEEQRKSLIEKFGETDDNGKLVVPADKSDDFKKAFETLVDTEVDFNVSKGVISGDIQIPLTALELSTLEPFFDFDY